MSYECTIHSPPNSGKIGKSVHNIKLSFITLKQQMWKLAKIWQREAQIRAWKIKICYLSIFENKSGIITYFPLDLCIVTLGNKFQMIFLHRYVYGNGGGGGWEGYKNYILILMSINLSKKYNSHSRKVKKK